MHASIWRFRGDPDALLRRYDAITAEIPAAAMQAHLCLRAPDGIVIVDTCPTQAAFESFSTGAFATLRQRHGLPEPERVEDYRSTLRSSAASGASRGRARHGSRRARSSAPRVGAGPAARPCFAARSRAAPPGSRCTCRRRRAPLPARSPSGRWTG